MDFRKHNRPRQKWGNYKTALKYDKELQKSNENEVS